ncbi:MAG: TCP-1/cpn60 chaperonin family protein [Methanosphaera sp.]|nr:TCP-1/cpn60 chaperonin family protein [Methanosphaera sp.]
MAQQQQQPLIILPEGTTRNRGRDAQRNNILAGKVLAETVRTTLGPKGMDKMLVDGLGDIVVTNDGVTILKEMDIEHPAAKMLVDVAKTQEDEVGDGTTTAVIIAGELLKKSEDLLDQEIHPTIIALGYNQAASKAIELLDDIAIDAKDKDTLLKVAMTAMTGKGTEKAREPLAELIVDAVSQVVEDDKVNTEQIKIESKDGAGINDSELVSGVIVDKEKVHPGMPSEVEGAKIALVNSAIEVKETEVDAEIRITDPTQMQSFIEQEEEMIKEMVDKLVDAGANVVFCQKGIDDLAQHYLSKAGILATRRVKKSDMEKLAKATGAKIVTNVEDLTAEDLGDAGSVKENKVAGDDMIFVKECKDPKAVTLLLRGSTSHIVEEVERAVEDAIGVVSSTVEDGKVVVGGGAPEVAIAKGLKDYAETISGREQLAVTAFAEALEVVPRTLAENAGLDSIDSLVDLRAAHEDSLYMGLNVFEGGVTDMKEAGVIEPHRVKKQAIQSAADAAEMILRIDDVIASSSEGAAAAQAQAGMGDMGGMGGMM